MMDKPIFVKMKKITVILVCFILVFSLTSCAVKPIESSEDDLRSVGVVEDKEILYEELRFIVLTYKKSILDSYGDDAFNDAATADSYREKTEQYFCETVTYNYAIFELCRQIGLDPYNSRVSEAVQERVEELSQNLGGFSKYKKYLKEAFLTDNVYRANVRVEIMYNELFYAYLNDLELIESDSDKIYDIIKDDFVRTQHVYVSKSTDGAKGKIESALSELSQGAAFWDVVLKYGEDSSLKESGEYITRGYMSDEYEKAAYDLRIDEYSDVIESENGYFIVKRLEQDPLYVMLNLKMLTERYQHYAFLEMIYEYQIVIDFTPNEYFYSLDLLEMN